MIDLNNYIGLEVIVVTKYNDINVGKITKDKDGFFILNLDDDEIRYISSEVIKSIELSK